MSEEATVHSLWDARVKDAAKKAKEKALKAYAKDGRQRRDSKLAAALEKYGSDKGLQNRKKPEQQAKEE